MLSQLLLHLKKSIKHHWKANSSVEKFLPMVIFWGGRRESYLTARRMKERSSYHYKEGLQHTCNTSHCLHVFILYLLVSYDTRFFQPSILPSSFFLLPPVTSYSLFSPSEKKPHRKIATSNKTNSNPSTYSTIYLRRWTGCIDSEVGVDFPCQAQPHAANKQNSIWLKSHQTPTKCKTEQWITILRFDPTSREQSSTI